MRGVIGNLILYFLLIGLAVGCATGKRIVDFDPDFAMEKLLVFSVGESSGANIDPLNSQRMYTAIQNYLTEKGYVFTEKSEGSDFVALYNVTVYKDVPSNFSIGIGIGGFNIGGIGGGIGTSVTPTTDNLHIRIDMYDPKTNKVFWSSSEVRTPDSFDTPESRSAFFKQVVTELLEKFPAQAQ